MPFTHALTGFLRLLLSGPHSRMRQLAATSLLALTACSPQYDWREVHGDKEPFAALLPGKPATFARPINLDGSTVTMQMTAAEVGEVTFAVGSATLADAGAAQKALGAMKTALVNNINGVVKRDTVPGELKPALDARPLTVLEVEASGRRKGGSQPLLLIGRFIARDNRVYQVIVVGPEKAFSREAAETFLSAFKAG